MLNAKRNSSTEESDYSVIALDKFIQSTRESGYKSTASAIAELVDNSLQAKARNVAIHVRPTLNATAPIGIAVVDDGVGMDAQTLRESLRFGGSSRFNDRAGLGRFGMGLPNASLSQSPRVDIYSWQRSQGPLWTFLDVEHVANGRQRSVPEPIQRPIPDWIRRKATPSGTVVVWENCDRADGRRVSTVVRRLTDSLGSTFRHHMSRGRSISVNGITLRPVDPLFLHPNATLSGASPFGEPWTVEIRSNHFDGRSRVGKVVVTFAELPLHLWHNLANDEKRRMGISDGAGVSIVRGDREIDFGWYFMGAKRRENYDDWWRCEVRFDPVLDEAFGITHTKQQIRPQDHVIEALQPQLETVGKSLNARVRTAFAAIKAGGGARQAEDNVAQKESKLRRLPKRRDSALVRKRIDDLARSSPALRSVLSEAKTGQTTYRLIAAEKSSHLFFQPMSSEGLVIGVLNPRHAFYRKLYGPLLDGSPLDSGQLCIGVQSLLLAAARAEASLTRADEIEAIRKFREEWSAVLEILLK